MYAISVNRVMCYVMYKISVDPKEISSVDGDPLNKPLKIETRNRELIDDQTQLGF